MKRFSLISLLILICSLPGFSQYWIEFGWNEPHCRQCLSMAQSLRLSNKQAVNYHKVVHRYGQRIEKEARRDYKYWDKAAARIFDLRMDRDRKIQKMLSPYQFNLYVTLTRERPQRIHDYKGWYENPYYAGRNHSPYWRGYEDRYWSYRWNAPSAPKKHYYDNRPPKNNKQNNRQGNNRQYNERENNRSYPNGRR